MRTRLLVLLLSLLAALAVPGMSSADVTVIGDDRQDAFIGSGSLLLPGSMYQQGRSEASDCPGCSWRAVLECEMTTAGSCRGPARLCGPDGAWLRIYLRRASGEEIDLGAACFGPSGPVTRESAEADLREIIRQGIPPMSPRMQPRTGALPHLPVIFDSGQPDGSQTSHHRIVDLSVDLTATPRWLWDFGDGSRMGTTKAGSRWPDLAVSHVYDRAGTPHVQVRTVWQAVYWVEGLGPLEVEEPVTQEATLPVSVGEGRAVLVR